VKNDEECRNTEDEINVKILFPVKIKGYGAHFEDWRTALLWQKVRRLPTG
jgi:hypothetical protein